MPESPPRRSRRPLAAALAVGVILALTAGALVAVRSPEGAKSPGASAGPTVSGSAGTPSPAASSPAAARRAIEEISRAVSKIRGLAFKRPVAAEVVSDAELARRVAEQFSKDNPRSTIEDDAGVLEALGLIGASDDLYSTLLGVQTEQVAGYYDPRSKRLVVGGSASNPTPFDRVLLAHELTHALTDQYFDLMRLERLDRADRDDEATAFLSLAEGDATLIMSLYAQQYLSAQEQAEFSRTASSVPTQRFDASPRIVRDTLLFPYQEGLAFAQALVGAGGMALVDAAYRDPPTSTEQILHPAKYVSARDRPRTVSLPDLAARMGAGWRSLGGGQIGEFDVKAILRQFEEPPAGTGEGWGGGAYAAAGSRAGAVVAVRTSWDSLTLAEAAQAAMDRWMPQRFGGATEFAAGADGRGWESPAGAGEVLRSGDSVLLLVGPDRASVERARAALPAVALAA